MGKRKEPGREPWMTDAGYASWVRANAAEPDVGKTAKCEMRLKCPHCGLAGKFALTASVMGDEPEENEHTCQGCGKEFYSYADLTISVEKDDPE